MEVWLGRHGCPGVGAGGGEGSGVTGSGEGRHGRRWQEVGEEATGHTLGRIPRASRSWAVRGGADQDEWLGREGGKKKGGRATREGKKIFIFPKIWCV